jgi:hypothetical protein
MTSVAQSIPEISGPGCADFVAEYYKHLILLNNTNIHALVMSDRGKRLLTLRLGFIRSRCRDNYERLDRRLYNVRSLITPGATSVIHHSA